MTKKPLIVLTSHDRLGDPGEKTGFWLEEFAAPYETGEIQSRPRASDYSPSPIL